MLAALLFCLVTKEVNTEKWSAIIYCAKIKRDVQEETQIKFKALKDVL